MPGGWFTLKVIPALFGFAFEITISRLQTWSDVVISHTRYTTGVVNFRTSVTLTLALTLTLTPP